MAVSETGFGERDVRQPLTGASPQLEIQSAFAGGWHTLRLSGELDLSSVNLLDDAIAHVGTIATDGTRLDLRRVTLIDSSGVRAVLSLREHCRQQGIEFQIIPGSPAVQRIFDVAGLGEVLPFQSAG